MTTGSCLCEAIKWRFDGVFTQITHCHCSLCRKAHGSAYATYGLGDRDSFRYVSGEDDIVEYESSPGFIRSFCRHCGSVVPNTKLGDIVAIPIGGLDGQLNRAVDAHIYVADKACWHDISDELPQHAYYPDRNSPVVSNTNLGSSSMEKNHGSCICGEVKFTVTSAFSAVRYCHCSRCRKARAAAHSANGVGQIESLMFNCGRELIREYSLPGADYFGQWFCGGCGSATARIDRGRNIVLVPFGALDCDPKQRPSQHIHVGSKADWDQITDQLPQTEAAPA